MDNASVKKSEIIKERIGKGQGCPLLCVVRDVVGILLSVLYWGVCWE